MSEAGRQRLMKQKSCTDTYLLNEPSVAVSLLTALWQPHLVINGTAGAPRLEKLNCDL